MKQCVKELHDKSHVKQVDNCSVAAAVKYLIDECMRAGDAKGAAVLSLALNDLKTDHSIMLIDDDNDPKIVSLLREILKLDKQELFDLIYMLETSESELDVP